MNFKINKNEAGWEISDTNKNPLVRLYTRQNKINSIIENGFFLDMALDHDSYKGGGFTVTDNIQELSPGFYKINRKYASERECSVVPVFECESLFKPSFYMIPGLSYNGNRWGKGKEPKGLSHNEEPWVFAYNRTTIPAATFSEDDKVSLGLFVDDKESNSLISACSIIEAESGIIHRIIWPDREEPMTYIGRDTYMEATQPEISFKKGETFEVAFYISLCAVEKKNFGWTKTLDKAWQIFKRDMPGVMDAEHFRKLRLDYIKKALYVRKGDYSLFEMGYVPNDDKTDFIPRSVTSYELGWCGQNASQALALIHDYINHKNEDSLQIALLVLDTWVTYATLDCGLFRVYFDDIIDPDIPIKYAIDTCNLGWGMWMLLEAYQSLKSVGMEKPAYYRTAINACDFFVKNRADNGSFGKMWSVDGTSEDTGGTIGCFILLGLFKAYELTQKTEYLDVVKQMFRYYVERDLNQMECTAGALDTQCVDKETCWPLFKIGLDLYELTKDKKYLDDSINAGYYLLSFMFHYDAIYAPDSDFTVHGYRTYGGTTVSAQHHHLDPWGSLLAYDFYRLYKCTGDEDWKIRAIALWKNAMLCVSDGEMIVHGIKRAASTQNEAFANCKFKFDTSGYPGEINDWLVAWPGAFKLLTMLRAEKDGIDKGFLS